MKSIPSCIQEKCNIELMQLLLEDYLIDDRSNEIYLFLQTHKGLKIKMKTKKWLDYVCSCICEKYGLTELDFSYNKWLSFIKSFDYKNNIL